jgi:hypothetical protein
MLPKEAEWINRVINKNLKGVSGTVINLGSSSMEFVTCNQPYIKDLVLDPLNRQFNVINVDIKSDANIQLVADFLTGAGQSLIKEKKGRVFLVSNLLEHVPNATEGIEKLKTLMEPGTFLILTGPRTFPYHPDPIDNRFRPRNMELKRHLESDFEILELDIVRNGTVFTSSFFGRSAKQTRKVASSQGGFLRLVLNPYFVFKMFRNLFYPASAFCVLAIKKTNVPA